MRATAIGCRIWGAPNRALVAMGIAGNRMTRASGHNPQCGICLPGRQQAIHGNNLFGCGAWLDGSLFVYGGQGVAQGRIMERLARSSLLTGAAFHESAGSGTRATVLQGYLGYDLPDRELIPVQAWALLFVNSVPLASVSAATGAANRASVSELASFFLSKVRIPIRSGFIPGSFAEILTGIADSVKVL